MTHQFADRDIEEIFGACTSSYTHKGNDTLCINYIGPTQSTYYTREDLVRMLDILDGKEEGVMRA